MEKLKVGDQIEVIYEDARNEKLRAVVTGFMTDEEQGFTTEIEDYVACWVKIAVNSGRGESVEQVATLGTDSRYSLNGRHVSFRKI
jgi:hypothetical protein